MSSSPSSGRRPKRFTGDKGGGLVEYALLISLIALVCFSAIVFFQRSTTNTLSKAAYSVGNAGS